MSFDLPASVAPVIISAKLGRKAAFSGHLGLRGESQLLDGGKENPHPYPLPEYRERERRARVSDDGEMFPMTHFLSAAL